MSEKLPEAEIIKRESDYLRGTILEGLQDRATGALPEDDTKLTKFHGSYQQDDRDLRDERRRQKLEPLYQFMVRLRLPGGVLSSQQWLGLDRIADECANSTLRLTTRQTFQFHGVFKEKMQTIHENGQRTGAGYPGRLWRRQSQRDQQRQSAAVPPAPGDSRTVPGHQ